jgi:hypothetical protein
MKALDIVKTPAGGIAIVTETLNEGEKVALHYINECYPYTEKSAWWDAKELHIIDSLPHLLASLTRHTMGTGQEDVEKFFGITNQ